MFTASYATEMVHGFANVARNVFRNFARKASTQREVLAGPPEVRDCAEIQNFSSVVWVSPASCGYIQPVGFRAVLT